MQKLGAFAVVQDRASRVLLCHRTDMDAWNLPGGGVEFGEAPWEAVVREVEEEAGLQVRVEELVGLYSVPDQQVLVSLFRCVRIAGSLRLGAEADAIDWFPHDALPASTLPRHVERITDAVSTTRTAIMKIQAG
ncbi:NUDIX domain-containing protein [Endozoicomonas sp. G2_2]|uniref:NUDIX hydrolase n=1 Tax=Endozoicomonas sp. G2_2 TaxID=2821092 RepID=UPI001AD9A577|nr:NUDIX domain-containing protein [Endozoicomonas sp. G2_2]MBO9471668.1 NUDIX domain-containing protein [Endozoicomonas sp. G2_2]